MLKLGGDAHNFAFARIVSALPGKRILIAGDVMLDEYLHGDAERISPEAPVPVVELKSAIYVPGGQRMSPQMSRVWAVLHACVASSAVTYTGSN